MSRRPSTSDRSPTRDLSASSVAIATPRADKSEGTDPENAARILALRMLERQPRTRAELERALASRGVPSDAATAVLDRFTEVGLINDEAFATAWVSSRHVGRGLGRRALTAELRRRGVADDLAREAVAELSDDDEESAARSLVQRRLRTMSGLTRETKVRRLVAMLARKGFGGGLARRVVADEVGLDVSSIAHDATEA